MMPSIGGNKYIFYIDQPTFLNPKERKKERKKSRRLFIFGQSYWKE